jgi:hypothetical protein
MSVKPTAAHGFRRGLNYTLPFMREELGGAVEFRCDL